jgi:hypothetical protein
MTKTDRDTIESALFKAVQLLQAYNDGEPISGPHAEEVRAACDEALEISLCEDEIETDGETQKENCGKS